MTEFCPGTLTVIDECGIDAELDHAIRALLVACFTGEPSCFSSSRFWHEAIPDYSVLSIRDGLFEAHTGVVLRSVRCGETTVAVAGIQNFCVLPACRGVGLGRRLMDAAMAEARRRDVSFGLLFCLPALVLYYEKMGWRRHHEPVTMRLNGGGDEPLPAKNVVMVRPLSEAHLPGGAIHLLGPDW